MTATPSTTSATCCSPPWSTRSSARCRCSRASTSRPLGRRPRRARSRAPGASPPPRKVAPERSHLVILDQLNVPIVLSPLAGGPTTPRLAAAVSEAGGLGFLAAGYLTADSLRDHIAQARALTEAPLGVNVFVPGGSPAAPETVASYAATLEADARAAGVALGEP